MRFRQTQVFRGARGLARPLSGCVVTLGAFDGVHRGHQVLLAKTVERARALSLPALAYTFDPHPAKVLAPHFAPRMLMPVAERIRVMAESGIDVVLVEPFDAGFAAVAADDWVERYLVRQLHPACVVVGFNFTYGRDRGGSPAHLQATGARFGFQVEVVEPVICSGGVASSTRVREFLLEGNVDAAELLLGRPFSLTGIVERGDARGATIGIPTANLAPENELSPATGVYATRVAILSGGGLSEEGRLLAEVVDAHDAVTNIGHRPTFEGTRLTVESHLFGFSGDLYGRRMRVELVARIRDERRFPDIDALVTQIRADIVDARRLLSPRP